MQLENILAAPAAPPAKPSAAPPREGGEPFEAEYARDPSEPPSAERVEATEEPVTPEPSAEEIPIEVEKLLPDIPVEPAPKAEAKGAPELVAVAPAKGSVVPRLVTEETVLPVPQPKRIDSASEVAPKQEQLQPVLPAIKAAEPPQPKPEVKLERISASPEVVQRPERREGRKVAPQHIPETPLPEAPRTAEPLTRYVVAEQAPVPIAPKPTARVFDLPTQRAEPAPTSTEPERIERTVVEIRAAPQLPVQRTPLVVAQSPSISHLSEAPRFEIVEESVPLQHTDTRIREVAHSPEQLAKTPELGRQVVRQIAEVARFLVDRPVEVSLSPEELGRVRMTIVQSDTGLSVNIQAERGETLDLIRRHIDELEGDFQAAGFADISFAFDQRTAEGQPEDPAPEQESAATSDAGPLQPVQVTVVRSGGLDLRL